MRRGRYDSRMGTWDSVDDRRYRRAFARRQRRHASGAIAGSLAVLAVVGVILALWVLGGSHAIPVNQTTSRSNGQVASAKRPLVAAESGLLPWHMPAPISREVVAAGSRGRLVVLGGLTAGGATTAGVYGVSTGNGRTRYVGALNTPVHDAAVSVIGGSAFVFGGGSSSTISTVQAFNLGGHSSQKPGSLAGSMPSPRSDAAAVTIGRTTYVVGGYDGTRADATVLATSDGRSFKPIATLPVPVRYPAVAALGGQIYVFGGQAIGGPHAGAPVNVIQVINPAKKTSARIGRLPKALAGAVAMTLHNEVFVAGGETARGNADATIWAFNATAHRLLPAGRLQVPVSHAGAAVIGSTGWIVGGETRGGLVSAVQMVRPNKAFGTAGAPGAGSPFFGAKLLIADRGNNRLLLLTDTNRVTWRYPSATTAHDPLGFYFPDDAFFTNQGTAILSNQEQNETIVKIAYPSGRIIWHYGHSGRPGIAHGYLHEPDDAYLLKNGQVTVADAVNCRVLVINKNGSVAHQIGTNGVCVHNPPRSMGSPNGDTPLADGNLLISEINGSWVSEYTPTGKLVWTVQLPISYPSDPQQLGQNRYLIADYASPGQILEFNRKGQILYRYHPASGPGRLDHPSLVEMLPSGVFMVNDDYNDRMVAIDPATKALVWQYGVTGRPGTGLGRLNTPDGFDLLLPNGTTPTHPVTG
jgi:hypothetical protein